MERQTLSSLINYRDIAQYIELLAGREDSLVGWRLISDSRKGRVHCIGSNLKDITPRLETSQDQGYGVFITLNELVIDNFQPTMKQTGDKIRALRACAIDADGRKLPKKWPLTPNFLMIRDDTHWHAYWLLATTDRMIANKSRWSNLQYTLALYFETDTAIHDVGRILRVPGTWHIKDITHPILTKLVVLDPFTTFTLQQLENAHPLPEDKKALAKGFEAVSTLKESTPGAELLTDNKAAIIAAQKRLELSPPPEKDEESTMRLYRAAAEIRELGISEEFAKMLIGEWVERGKSYRAEDEKVIHQIESAYKYAQNPSGVFSVDVFPKPSHKIIEEARSQPTNFTAYLRVDKHNKPLKNLFNVSIFFEHHPDLKDKFVKDVFTDRYIVRGKLSFYTFRDAQGEHYMSEDITHALRVWMAVTLHFEPSMSDIQTALENTFAKHQYHPVKDFLTKTEWDGTPRLREWLITYTGVEDTEYAQHVGEMTLVAAVSRIFEPGIKYDYMLIMEGKQAVGKSSTWNILGGDWYREIMINDPNNKDMIMQCHSAWLLEWSELKNMRKTEVRDLKAFITRQVDEYRKPYGRYTTPYPRQFIIIGTTNDSEYLQDETGARRFLIVEAKNVNFAGLIQDRTQLWAEAYHKYKEGYSLALPHHLKLVAAQIADQRFIDDAWADLIATYVGRTLESQGHVKIREVWTDCLAGFAKDCNKSSEIRIAKILKKLGLSKCSKRIGQRTHKVWVKK